MTVGRGVPLGVGLNEGDMDGAKEGVLDGFGEGGALGADEGVREGSFVGGLEGEADGNDVEGEELGNAVTSRSRQTSSASQQTLQHLQTTSAGLSPSISARQSAESSSIEEAIEHRPFGTTPNS